MQARNGRTVNAGPAAVGKQSSVRSALGGALATVSTPRLAGILLAGILGFVLVPRTPEVPGALLSVCIFRGVIAGAIVGLAVERYAPNWFAAALAAVAAGVGAVVVRLTAGDAIMATAGLLAVAIAAFAGSGFAFLSRRGDGRPARVLAIGIVVFMTFWIAGLIPVGPFRAADSLRSARLGAEPQPEEYRFDGDIYLRTYYLMKQGEGYYEAFQRSFIEDSRLDEGGLVSPFNYREPFVFYLWNVLPGRSGTALHRWFVLYAVLVIIASYLTASALTTSGVALLAPVALVSYYTYFFWKGSWFTMTELWAAGFGVAAVCLLIRRRYAASLVLLTIAVAAREFMVLLIPAWLLAWWFTPTRRPGWWFPASAILGPLAVLAAHLLAVPHTPSGPGGLMTWLHGGSLRLKAALQFGFDRMPAGGKLSLAIAALAIFGAALATPRWKRAALGAATLLPTLFLLVFGASEWSHYWGAFYSPLALSVFPGAWGRVLPASTQTLD